jgi:hypothetical protein
MGRDSNFVEVTLLYMPDALEAQEVPGMKGPLGQLEGTKRHASFMKWESPDKSERPVPRQAWLFHVGDAVYGMALPVRASARRLSCARFARASAAGVAIPTSPPSHRPARAP